VVTFHATIESEPLRFRILGALEAEVGERAVELGGGKQRAVLAALLLRAGEVVPDGRLIDEIWGESPPASAAHSLEAYVSKLRGALAPSGVALERHGGGYRIVLGAAVLDADVFTALADDAAQASAAGAHARTSALAQEALGLWRGPVLAGIALHADGRAEAERLDELRWRTLEISNDADLALGRHAELVGELRRLVEESPYRERLVAQLMVALYRSGRQAEALDVYERTRRRLDDDLGLQPSAELQRLAGQIVRQDPELRAPSRSIDVSEKPTGTRRRVTRGLAIAVLGVTAIAAAILALGLVVWPDSAVTGSGAATRVALIRQWNPGAVGSKTLTPDPTSFVEGLLASKRTYKVETEIVDLFARRPPGGEYEDGSPADVARLSARLEARDFDLVLWPLALPGPNFLAVIPRYPETRFVFLDWCCANGEPNVTGIALRTDHAAHLAGYLSGLMEARRSRTTGRRPMVSSITGDPDFPQQMSQAQGFASGARLALPGVDVREDYSHDYENAATCERIANEQIEAGSGVVFAVAGECRRGALSAAAVRGVWGVASEEDLSYLGPHILASATARYDRLVEVSVGWFLQGRLPPGGNVALGLAEDAVALVGISPVVPAAVRRRVAQEAARLRAQEVREPE
jgi:DNA-binding SARP family transcriptional activator/basic membrane lipoprotein Med (substrate-binding protein (PBP1-ABC) superfamily)